MPVSGQTPTLSETSTGSSILSYFIYSHAGILIALAGHATWHSTDFKMRVSTWFKIIRAHAKPCRHSYQGTNMRMCSRACIYDQLLSSGFTGFNYVPLYRCRNGIACRLFPNQGKPTDVYLSRYVLIQRDDITKPR